MAALKRFLRDPRTIRASQVLISLVFIVAALAKLGDLHAFAEQVINFRILPLALANRVAMTLPWIELIAGLAMLFGVRARSGAVVGATLMAVFTLAVVAAMARGLDFECGCFGTADATRVGLSKVGQNVAMLILALVGSIRPR